MPPEPDLGERIQKLMSNLRTLRTESEEREKRKQIAEQGLEEAGEQRVLEELIGKYQGFYDNEDYEAALEIVDAILEKEPDNYDYMHRRGDILGVLGRPEEAFESYAKALELNPTLKLSNKDISFLRNNYYYVWYWTWKTEGKSEQTLRIIDKLLEFNHYDFSILSNKGEVLRHLGRKKEALECYTNLTKIDPNNRDAWFLKGSLSDDLGNYNQAIGSYEKLLEMYPHDSAAWNNKGVALSNLGMTKEAIRCYKRALRIDPTDELYIKNLRNTKESLPTRDVISDFFKSPLFYSGHALKYFGNTLDGIFYFLKDLLPGHSRVLTFPHEFEASFFDIFLKTGELKQENGLKERSFIYRQRRERLMSKSQLKKHYLRQRQPPLLFPVTKTALIGVGGLISFLVLYSTLTLVEPDHNHSAKIEEPTATRYESSPAQAYLQKEDSSGILQNQM